MAVGDNRKNPRIRGVSGTRQVTSIVVNNPQGTQQGSSDTATWATKNNQDLIPSSKLPATSSPIDQNAVDARVRAGVYPWGLQNNNDPIPRDKLTNAVGSGETSLLLASKEATLTLPTLAETTLTAASVNTYIYQALGAFAGNGVALYIVPSVVSNVGRITFPNEGFISGKVTASLNVHSDSTAGSSQALGHLSFIVNLYNHDNTLKETWKHTHVINDPVNQDFVDPIDVSINMTPINANSYLTVQLAFESSVANQTVVVDIPAASTNRREQVDLFYYTKEQVANWAVENNTDKIPVEKLPTSATEGLNQSEVDARILPFARDGNTDIIPANKLPPGNQGGGGAATWATPGNTDTIPPDKLPPGIGGDSTADWAKPGNTDPIPPEKLKSVLDEANEVLELRPNDDSTVATTITLPADFATRYKYLAIGGSTGDPPTAWGEYGIIDLEYLNAFETLSITSQVQPGRYEWTKSTRTITGRINGAYLYGFTDGRDYTEEGWIRDPGTTQIPTTASNDGIEGIDVPDNIVNKYPFFACSLWGPGTVTFLPNQFYKDIPEGQSRIFRVYDEANTSTLKVSNGAEFEFDAHNENTDAGVNTMRDARFLKFGELENITPNAVVTTLQLPDGYKDKDFFIAVTKNPAHSYWTMWTIRTRINFETTRLSLTGLFNPGANIVYAALVKVNTELALQAEDVHVDVSNFNTLTGDNVQTALAELDVKAGEITAVKDYAKSGNTTDKIPLSDYATIGTTAELAAISTANQKLNHLYIEI